MRLDSFACVVSKARDERIHRGIGIDLGGIDVEFFAPDEVGLLALLDNCVKKAAEHIQSIPRSNAAQARMIRQWFVEIIAEIPADAEPVSRLAYQLAFRADVLEEHH